MNPEREASTTSRWIVLGDSLSDGMWARDPAGVGSAWPGSVARLAAAAGTPLSIRNRSRGGARSIDILEALRQETSIVSGCGVVVFAGANDLWRRWVPWQGQDALDADDYARNIKAILGLCREEGAIELVVMTPCLLNADPAHPWNIELSEYRDAAARVAGSMDARLVPSGEEFALAVRSFPEVKWTYDSIHPRPVGHERIALTWMRHVLGRPAWPTDRLPDRPDGFRLSVWP